ncbi:uncharacterized protein LOC133515207 isoform X3 [Syngnathoides biaculeatus]|uniref:uncharacterized protein LOC133515207 isoform X3 n=1 Tax=Syngnathoides biaculeatus TaxID=300417 RepID=UPI002ADD46FF|nr:uncharacterized protein LOC133515207 isoform X3 [Syngnathoides biaculeatus]
MTSTWIKTILDIMSLPRIPAFGSGPVPYELGRIEWGSNQVVQCDKAERRRINCPYGLKKVRNPDRMYRSSVCYAGHGPPKTITDDTDTNNEHGHLKIYLPKKLLECLPKCTSLPKERHRWNTNESHLSIHLPQETSIKGRKKALCTEFLWKFAGCRASHDDTERSNSRLPFSQRNEGNPAQAGSRRKLPEN